MDPDKFAHDFIRRMDAGEFDGRVVETIQQLTLEQLASITSLLLERERREPKLSASLSYIDG